MRNFLLLTLLLCSSLFTQARTSPRGFAIVVDPKSHAQAKPEIDAYAKAIKDCNGLDVFIVEDRWGIPDSIRAELKRLHASKQSPIEGAVLMGDIPVVMVRDAQHMTSAFKMNQARDRKESSVPSDRFYDDFGLKFNYIGKDEDAPYYYYSLRADSRQYLTPTIYTGRIRPTDAGGTSRYEKLRDFLRKAVAEKRKSGKLQQMLFFNGHGYVSGSLMARIDEKQGLYEHFPWLRQQQNGISYISHTQQDVTKFLLMNELQRPDLDFAILHHHGAPDTQYLDGAPQINTAEQAKKFIQDYSRSYLRHLTEGKRKISKDSAMAIVEKRFDIPASWISNTWDSDVIEKDSTSDSNENIVIGDFAKYGYKPNCRVVIIDACFTGSFHLDDCIADEYIFSSGRTVAVVANSLNVLQDKWSDRYMGVLGLGVPVGYIPAFSGYLESHLIGDPTFTYASSRPGVDVCALLASPDYKVWSKYLSDDQLPDLRSLAIEKYHRAGKLSSDELLKIFHTSGESPLVRIEALYALADQGGSDFVEAIRLGITDSYELVQRFALNFLGQSGDLSLIPDIIKIAISNNTSERVNYSTMNALTDFPGDKLMAEFARQFDRPEVSYIDKDKVRATIAHAIESSSSKWTEDIDKATSDTTNMRYRQLAIRTTRNYTPPFECERLMQAVTASSDTTIEVMLLESLGWRNHSYMAPRIAEFAKKLSEDKSRPEVVRQEALKTYNRVRPIPYDL